MQWVAVARIAGLLIDGGVRDAAETDALGFPVFSRSNASLGTRKDFCGAFGHPLKVGHTGDLVVGDVAGVVALPPSGAEPVLDRTDERVAHENKLMKRPGEGHSTLDLYDDFEAAGR